MSDNAAVAVKAPVKIKGVQPKVKGNPLIKKPTAAHVAHTIALLQDIPPNTLEPVKQPFAGSNVVPNAVTAASVAKAACFSIKL